MTAAASTPVESRPLMFRRIHNRGASEIGTESREEDGLGREGDGRNKLKFLG
jgi:hypothetical protein